MRIDYIFAVPEEHDIYIAGHQLRDGRFPKQETIVEERVGKPIFRLEDLLTILRAWNAGFPK